MFAYKKRHKQKRQICKCISCDDIVIMSLTVTDIDKITLKHLYIEMIAFFKTLVHHTQHIQQWKGSIDNNRYLSSQSESCPSFGLLVSVLKRLVVH